VRKNQWFYPSVARQLRAFEHAIDTVAADAAAWFGMRVTSADPRERERSAARESVLRRAFPSALLAHVPLRAPCQRCNAPPCRRRRCYADVQLAADLHGLRAVLQNNELGNFKVE